MKRILLFICFSVQLLTVKAEEGMLIPSLISAFEDDMKAMGMKLSAEDLYSINQASIKDAIIHFGGGCTAEIVSKQGLLLTNHHCGYSQIQSHSSLKNDYLKNGFWAKKLSEELPNDGLTATRIVRIEDLTNQVLEGTDGIADLGKRMALIQKNIQDLQVSIVEGTHYKAEIKAFDYGNSYYALVTEVFLDVRLVGTPPNAIGKFGGDTDNWVWPRHTGDFAVFRIYAGKDNKPAAYSADNVPYAPLYSLKIAAGDRVENEFTMVYGFPGQTEQHLISSQIQYIMEKERPARIAMREKSLSVIDAAMRSSDEIRIQYSSKQARIANAYKKWIGQVDGLQRLDAINVKIAAEKEFNDKANSTPEWKAKYGNLVADMNRLIQENNAFDFGYAMTVEYLFVGPEFFAQVRNMNDLVTNYEKYKANNQLDGKIESYKKSAEGFFKNYNMTVDQGVFNLLHEAFIQRMDPSLISADVTAKNTVAWSKLIFTKSVFVNQDKLISFYDNFKESSIKKIEKDPAFMLNAALMSGYQEKIIPSLRKLFIGMDEYIKLYIEGKQTMFPAKKHWPDANGTLRITYGKLEGSFPRDGMAYTNHTTTAGIIEKNRSGNPDFELLPGMLELYQQKDFGDYAQDGELWVCFSGSNHTTGGNSGSPVLNAKGHLMGLNFDRSWESTMSDYMFDPTRCRNIAVDIRYVLWVIDKYAGAKHLVDEMELVR